MIRRFDTCIGVGGPVAPDTNRGHDDATAEKGLQGLAVGHEFEWGCVALSRKCEGGFSLPSRHVHWRYTHPIMQQWVSAEQTTYWTRSLEPPRCRN